MRVGTIKIIHKVRSSDLDSTDSLDQVMDLVLLEKCLLEGMKS